MRIINAVINEPIVIGKQGENNATSVIFDIADLIELYGTGTVELWHKRSGEVAAYLCNITQNSNHAVWEIKSKDTANAGYGKCQLVYKVNDDVAKSIIWTTVVGSSLVFGNDEPDVDPTPETYLPLSGGTMTGPLILDASPVINLQAATKRYVDDGLNTKQDKLIIDNIPLENSINPISSGAVYSSLSGKQNTLTFDNVPKANSNNPVKSGGIYTALSGKQNSLTFDDVPTENSNNPVTSGGVYTAIQNATAGSKGIFWCDYGVTTYADIEIALAQDMLPVVYKDGFIFVFRGSQTPLFGHTFTSETGGFGSVNVKFVYCSSSSAWSTTSWIHVFNQDDLDIALSGKQNTLTFDTTPIENSVNPVTSGGIYASLQNLGSNMVLSESTQPIWKMIDDGIIPTVYISGGCWDVLDYGNIATSSSGNANHKYIKLYQLSVDNNESIIYKVKNYVGQTKAQNTYAQCKYFGTWGNLISITIRDSLSVSGKKDVITFYNNKQVDLQTVSASTGLVANDYVTWKIFVMTLVDQSPLSGGFDGYTTPSLISSYTLQESLTFDNTPTANSDNPVKSSGVKSYVDDICGDIETALSTINTALGGMV